MASSCVNGSAKCSPTATLSVLLWLEISAFCFNPFIDKEETLLLGSIEIVGGSFCCICSILASTFSSTFGMICSGTICTSSFETISGWIEVVDGWISFAFWKKLEGIIKYLAFFFRHHVLMKPIA